MTFGIDIGTTSVGGVAVDATGKVVACVTLAHEADVPGLPDGRHEQDPDKLLAATNAVRTELTARVGKPDQIGWTGQMHGVVGTDAELRPVTNFVTWRDVRRYGGRVMSDWSAQGMGIHRCLPVCALCAGLCETDPTLLHAWYLDESGLAFPPVWLPQVTEGRMIGDNQAGVYAAQRLFPGCAVVNLGTSGQLSVVRDRLFVGPSIPGRIAPDGSRWEERPYPGGRTLLCRASLAGGAVWSALRNRLGLTWEEMNTTDDPRVVDCARRIVDNLFGDVDLSGVSGLVGVGNALMLNPALRSAVERKSGCVCHLPELPEMAACGAAFLAMDGTVSWH